MPNSIENELAIKNLLTLLHGQLIIPELKHMKVRAAFGTA
jgi:hypothetical protein